MFHDGFMNGSMWFGWFFWIILIVLVIWLIVNQSNRNRQSYEPPMQETTIDILTKRYAKGEISKEEFERIKKGLNN